MKRLLTIGLALFLIGTTASAENNYVRYYTNLPITMQQVSVPVIPATTVSLKDYGAVGDGITLCTEAFSKAMSDLNKRGGGHLNVPEGVWLTGPISFKDNIDLHIDKNAIIIFSPDKSLFNKDSKGNILERCVPAINISKRKNVSVTGEGIIDGSGKYWRPVKRGKVSDAEWSKFKSMGGTETEGGKFWFPYHLNNGLPEIASSVEASEKLRADLIRITDCENVLIEGVVFQNSPRFHVHPVRCKNVIIDGITVRCPWNAQNGDGIDLSNVNTALIVNTTVDSGDDGICMKGGSGKNGLEDGPCKDILIDHCTVYHAHGGFVIGSDVSGGMQNIVVRNCRFSGTDTGLRFKSGVGRGGKTENIFINNIVMNDITNDAIVFECTYVDNKLGNANNNKNNENIKKEVAPFTPDFQDIHISDIICREAKHAINMKGLPEQYVHDIDIKNATIVADEGIDIQYARNIKMNNVKINAAKAPIITKDCENVTLNGNSIK